VLQKIQQTIKQSAIYTLPGIASQLIGVILVPIYTRIFVPADYGIMAGIALITPITTLLLMFAIEQGVARYYLDSQDERDKKLTAATGLYFVAILSFSVISIVVLFFSKEISQLVLNDTKYSTYFILALTAIPFSLCYKLALDILRFRFQATRRTIIGITNMLVSVGLSIYLVVFLRMGITGVFLATLITNIIFCITVLFLVKSNYALIFSFKRLKELFIFSAPLVPATMTLYAFHYADRYFLIHMTTLEELGLYSIGVTIASAVLLLMVGFRGAWVPIVLSSFREEESKQFYVKIFDYFWALIFLGTVGISLFSKEILAILAPETYLGAYTVVPILILSLVLFNGVSFFTFGITIAKKTQYRLPLAVIVAAINVGLNYLLIPVYGMVGAAIATLISSIVYAVASFIISQKLYYVSYNLASFFKILAVVIMIISVSYFLFSDISLQNILIKVGLIGIFMACLYLFNLIGKEELTYLRKLAYRVLLRRKDITQI